MINDRIAELVKQLNAASRAYYQNSDPIMTDFEYDKLYDELIALENESGLTLPDSPTQNVGYSVVENLIKVTHESRMLSLDKTKEVTKLVSFLGDKTGILSWKLDGLTIVVTYENGRLVQAVTRGNGEIGEDVTHNALVFRNLPKRISYKDKFTVRGEAVISFVEFDKINESILSDGQEQEQYKNPRNLCSGTVRQLNSEVCAKRKVDFFAFTLVGEHAQTGLKSDGLKWLVELGFGVAGYKIVDAQNISEAVSEFKANIAENGYASDGLVLTFDDIEYSRSLGETSKFPRDSIAYKWADETAVTTLKEIIWNTSRTGLINPIAVFEPVQLEGTTTEKASLHNVSIVEELMLGIGDEITVYKANMIIPQIAENLTKSATARPPEHCPVCGENTSLNEVSGVKTLYCINPGCPAQSVEKIAHYASRDALNIEGFSRQTVEKFFEKGLLQNYTDIYEIERHGDTIKAMKGFGERSYEKMIKAINKSKSVRPANFIYGLGINHVGLSNAKLLCKHFGDDIEKLRQAAKDGGELTLIPGVGEIIASSVALYFSEQKNIELLEKALSYLTLVKADKKKTTDGQKQGQEQSQPLKFDGKTFVITGETLIFKNRGEVKDFIEQNGGKVSSSVSSKTNYLVNNDIDSTSSKNAKAKELGVEIITESQLKSFVV